MAKQLINIDVFTEEVTCESCGFTDLADVKEARFNPTLGALEAVGLLLPTGWILLNGIDGDGVSFQQTICPDCNDLVSQTFVEARAKASGAVSEIITPKVK